jgi:hypothetical protein
MGGPILVERACLGPAEHHSETRQSVASVKEGVCHFLSWLPIP